MVGGWRKKWANGYWFRKTGRFRQRRVLKKGLGGKVLRGNRSIAIAYFIWGCVLIVAGSGPCQGNWIWSDVWARKVCDLERRSGVGRGRGRECEISGHRFQSCPVFGFYPIVIRGARKQRCQNLGVRSEHGGI